MNISWHSRSGSHDENEMRTLSTALWLLHNKHTINLNHWSVTHTLALHGIHFYGLKWLWYILKVFASSLTPFPQHTLYIYIILFPLNHEFKQHTKRTLKCWGESTKVTQLASHLVLFIFHDFSYLTSVETREWRASKENETEKEQVIFAQISVYFLYIYISELYI